jgi:hypothetical protein
MRRLRDELHAHRSDATWSSKLFEAASEPNAAQAPVQRAMMERLAERLAPKAPTLWHLRPAVLMGLLAATAVASAAIEHHASFFWRQWKRSAHEESQLQERPPHAGEAPSSRSSPPSVPALPSTQETPVLAPVPLVKPPATGRIASVATKRPADRMIVRSQVLSKALPPIATPTPMGHSSLDSPPREGFSPLVDATRALRVDHNPARAAVLSEQYLQAHPDGALVEEALTLGMEACEQRGDLQARLYANRYLQAFPKGRYAHVAHRILDTTR